MEILEMLEARKIGNSSLNLMKALKIYQNILIANRCHQVGITEEDKRKTTFITEWGSFAYNVMSFGLMNAPAIFSRIVIASFREFIHKFIEVTCRICLRNM